MKHIDRLVAIRNFLQSRQFTQPEKISEKFGISIRTVYRDVKTLNDSGTPVLFERGKGYCIPREHFLAPVSLTIEEANALILLNSLAGEFADQSIVRYATTAMEKIRAVLKQQGSEKAERQSEKVLVYSEQVMTQEGPWLADIQRSISNSTTLDIRYTDNVGRHTRREIEPIGLIYYTGQWHLYAWCCHRQAYRDFKTKKITGLRDTLKPQSKIHPGLAEYINTF